MSVRMRKTSGKTRSRRAHHKLDAPRLSRDTETQSTHLRHHVDLATGMYRGKKIFEPAPVKAKKAKESQDPEEASPAPEEALTPIEETTPASGGTEVSKEAAAGKAGEPKGSMPAEAAAPPEAPRQSKKDSA